MGGALGACVALLAGAAPAQAQPVFAAPVAVGAGANPYGSAVGDFNRDGNPDFAITNFGGDTVSVRLGDGAGGFTTRPDLVTGQGPDGVAVGDFDGDGNPDLAVSNDGPTAAPSTLTILLGDGTGGFTPTSASPPTGVNPRSVKAGYFDADTDLDLAVTNSKSPTVSVLLGDGSGGFTPTPPVATTDNPTGLEVADLDGDGDADLATTNRGTNTVEILRGDGTGSFVSDPQTLQTGSQPSAVVAGDLNGDGNPDLVTSNASLGGTTPSVSTFLGDGSGGFTARPVLPTAAGPADVEVGDFDRDAKLDIATSNSSSNSVSVLAGNGDGTFGTHADYPTGSVPLSLAVADFDRDGDPDLVTADYGAGSASVLIGTPILPAAPVLPAPPVSAPPPVRVRDTVAPVITGSKLSTTRFSVNGAGMAAAARGSTLTYRLSESATVVYATQRLKRGKWRTIRVFATKYRTGGQKRLDYSGKIKPRGKQRPLASGRFRLRIRPADPAGNRGRLTTRYFRIVR